MSIRAKMFSILGAVTLLLIALALTVNYEIARFSALKASQILSKQLATEMLELRRNEKDFLARKDTKYLDRFDKKYSDAANSLSRLTSQLDELSIDATEAAQVRQDISAYVGRFKELAELQIRVGLNATSGLYGSLRRAAHDAETILAQHSDHELLVNILMLRRAEKDFMLRKQMKYVEKFAKGLQTLEQALSAEGLSNEAQQAARNNLQVYRAEFLALVDAEKRIGLTPADGLLGKLRESVHRAENHLTSLFTSLDDRIEVAEAKLQWTLYSVIIGIMLLIASLLLWMAVSITSRINQVSNHMQQIALGDGDLSQRLDERDSDEITLLSQAFNSFSGKIHDMLKTIAERVAELGETDDRVNRAAQETDHSMHELGTNTQSVVVATEELSATACDVSKNASNMSASARQAAQEAVKGQTTVGQAINAISSFAREFGEAADTVASLRSESENIGAILDVIRGIAEQTNLLALNAAIEAARAGEQGRGFAVVADEVRGLAHRSQESTNEIQALIERLQQQSETAMTKILQGKQRISETVTEAEKAGASLATITESIGTISDMTTQIATAAEEQSAVVSDINTNVVAIDSLAQITLQNAETTTSLTAELAAAMSAVARELQNFRFTNDEQLVLAQAKSAHLAWKARLREFLDGNTQLSQAQAVDHHQCDLGKWYYGKGLERFGHLPEFKAIEQPHATIHRLIKEVIDLKAKGSESAAETAYQEVMTVSEHIVKQLDGLAASLR